MSVLSQVATGVLFKEGLSLYDKKQYDRAEVCVLEMLQRDMNDHAALALLGEIYLARGNKPGAIALYMKAVGLDPGVLRYQERFIELAGTDIVTAHSEKLDRVMAECLRSAGQLDCMKMRILWMSHMQTYPGFREAYDCVKKQRFEQAVQGPLEGLSNFKPPFTDCFLLGLRHIVTECDFIFEELITQLRQRLLMEEDADQKFFTAREVLLLAASLAQYSFNTDYILGITEAEQNKVDALQKSVETDMQLSEKSAVRIALVACYIPLYRLKNTAHIARIFAGSPDLAEVIRTQITDYFSWRETADGVTALTPVDGRVSALVQKQYEEFPYPRWRFFQPEALRRAWQADPRKEGIEGPLCGKKTEILIAGCGTGQEAVQIATLFPEAEILAIDLSRSSLAYASRKAEEYAIRNITFRQADILRLDGLERKFDYIISAGVLHHLEDPFKGWHILCGLLKPGGLMRIALYSTMARSFVYKARDAISQGGYASDAAGMRAFRGDCSRLLGASDLYALRACQDYYYLNMYRDLLFHVQEHSYNLAEIQDMLQRLKLNFVGFSYYAIKPALLAEYEKLYPQDAEKKNLLNWHDFEMKNPATFLGMYNFWCRKEGDGHGS